MGNCIPGSPEIAANRTSSFLTDLFNFTSSSDYDYYTANDTDYATDDASYAAAQPCHSHYCPFFHRVAPPLLTATGATAVVATAALLLALALRPHAWPRGRALVAQLALCSALFAVTLFPMAAGIAWGWRAGEGPCRAVLLLWHGSVLAQGLLLGCGERGRARCVPVVLWVTGMAMAVPAALSGGAVGTGQSTQCVQRSVAAASVAYVLQLAACCCVLLLLLPGAMLRGMWGAVGRGPGWLFWALWAPYGAALVGGFLLEAGVLPPNCGAFEGFDFALGLSAALGGLHCCLVPLALLLAAFGCHKGGDAP